MMKYIIVAIVVIPFGFMTGWFIAFFTHEIPENNIEDSYRKTIPIYDEEIPEIDKTGKPIVPKEEEPEPVWEKTGKGRVEIFLPFPETQEEFKYYHENYYFDLEVKKWRAEKP